MDAVASYSSPSPRLESGRVGSGGGQWEMNNIEDSMARMEKLLQRGRALLYGDGASEGRGRHSATLGRVSGGPRESGSHESQRKLRELIEMANAACRAVKRARALDARTRKVKERGAVGWSATQRALPSTLYQQSAALIQAGKRMQMARGGVQQEVLKGGDDREDVPILDLLQRIRRELDDYRRTGLASKGQPCKFARAQKTKEVTSLSLYSRSSTIKSSSLMRLVTPPVTPSQDIRQMFSKGRVSSGGVTTKGPPIENRNAYGKTLGSRRGIGKWNTMYDRSVSFKSLASVASPATKPFAHTYTDPYVARGEPQNNRWETLYAHAVYLQEKRRTYGNDGDALSTKVLQRQISSKGCVPLCPPQPSQHVHRLSGEATVHEQSKRGQSGTNEAQCGTTKPVLDAGSRRFERIIVHPSLSGKPSWGGGECKMRRPVPMRIPTGRQNAPLLSPFGAAERRDGNAETGQNKAQRAEVATTGVAGGGVVPTIGIPRTTPGVSGARAARTTSVPKMPLTPRSLRRTPSTLQQECPTDQVCQRCPLQPGV
ncbi:hypothetical protein TRVL_04936 [Trypanosoma vivax]|nr:hypothetical protein TRVL_04936 [Trypanosoma vivax]